MPNARTAFISYSHDSEDHKSRVLALSNRLRQEGVDCTVDQYESSPPEGWPQWMTGQITQSDFVLVVCTETYTRRVTGQEEPGRGLGAIWEGGLITQEIYNAGGQNTRFLPVLFDPADAQHIPPYLQSATYYLLSASDGYDTLYRRLTAQPAVERPPLGAVRELPADPEPAALDIQVAEPPPEDDDRDWSSLVLLMPEQTSPFLARSIRIESGEPQPFGGSPSSVTLELETDGTAASARLAGLRGIRGTVGVAYGSTGLLGRVTDVRQVVEGGRETWRVVLEPQQGGYGAGLTEMAFEGYSADDIARLRARRILLDERLPGHERSSQGQINASMLESLVQGVSVALRVKRSPFPAVFASYRADTPLFLATVRLFAVLFLRLSGTVEHVLRLDLSMDGPESVRVMFEGTRFNPYSNVDATRLEVAGVCDLADGGGGTAGEIARR